MKVRFITDGVLDLAGPAGIVTVNHRKGEVVELEDTIADLFITGGSALRVVESERTVKPKAERAVRAKKKRSS